MKKREAFLVIGTVIGFVGLLIYQYWIGEWVAAENKKSLESVEQSIQAIKEISSEE